MFRRCANLSDGTTCAVGRICNAGSSSSERDVGGHLYTSGTANPNNVCQACGPATSTGAFSNMTDGTACATGKVCNAGACDVQCAIAGMLYAAGAANPNNVCQICTPGTPNTAWSDAASTVACTDDCNS